MNLGNKKRVLIFPCGSEVGLEINRALANDIHFEMYGASSLPDHGRFVYKNYIEGVPFVDNENFINEIERICREHEIDFIFPAHDSVVLKLAQNKDKISAKIVTSPVETCEIARSKIKTYKTLKDTVKIPKIYNINDNIPFPVFVKPDIGQGSKGARIINNKAELEIEYDKNKNIIICELLPGKEYTVDCFTGKSGDLLFAKGRTRARINNGISVNSAPANNNEFFKIAKKINSKIKFKGMWFFQLKEDASNHLTLLEIAPRIAGTMGLYRGLGVNFAQLALYDFMGYDVSIINNDFNIEIDRALFARYKTDLNYDTVYIDFDDTILIGNEINTDIMKFLYQTKNNNKKIILITKHAGDINKTLKKYYISDNIFDNIIQIAKTKEKSDYITHKNAIFIDDSFAERQKINKIKNIPVFGIDAIETLFDYKN